MNGDRKTSVAVLSSVCSRVFSEGLDRTQNGFIRGRKFVNDVIDLDGHARIESQAAAASPRAATALPGLAAWGYSAVFV